MTCGAFAQPVPEYLQGFAGGAQYCLVDRHQLVELTIRHRVWACLTSEGECGYRIDDDALLVAWSSPHGLEYRGVLGRVFL